MTRFLRIHLLVLILFTSFSLLFSNWQFRVVSLRLNTISLNEMVPSRFVVKSDVDLQGRTLVLPPNSKLVFRGGSIYNGTIELNGTIIRGDVKMYCTVSGSVKNKSICANWFFSGKDLDEFFSSGVFSLRGMSKIYFLKDNYVASVRSMTEGICAQRITIDGNDCTISAKKGGRFIYSLFPLSNCENVTIKNIILVGSNENYAEEGARHNLVIYRSSGITVENVTSMHAFTDGLYIRNSDHVRVKKFIAHSSGRQGCSITSGSNLEFSDCIFEGSYRVAPKSGFDIEPNYAEDVIDNIRITRCKFLNNKSSGLTINLTTRREGATCTIDVSDCMFDGNSTNISVSSLSNSGVGYINIENCYLKNSKWASFQSKKYSAVGTPIVLFHDSILENANLGAGNDVREHATFISIHNVSSKPLECDFGNIQLKNLIIKQEKSISNTIKRVISLYPDQQWSIDNVDISNISIDIEDTFSKGYYEIYIPKRGLKTVSVK